MNEDIVFRLRKRAEIRRSIPTRKSVQEGEPDRIADLLEEAATVIETAKKAAGDKRPKGMHDCCYCCEFLDKVRASCE